MPLKLECPLHMKNCRCLFPACYRERASVQLKLGCGTQLGNSSFPFPCLLQGRSRHATEAPLFHPACYLILECGSTHRSCVGNPAFGEFS